MNGMSGMSGMNGMNEMSERRVKHETRAKNEMNVVRSS
jgi:hypothetical protein